MPSWKAVESRLAKRLGGVRNPITGRGDKPDVESARVTVEVKSRRTLPKWLTKALRQSQAAKDGKRLPIVILHEMNSRYDDAVVLIRLEDFEGMLDAHPAELSK